MVHCGACNMPPSGYATDAGVAVLTQGNEALQDPGDIVSDSSSQKAWVPLEVMPAA